jgi:two-component system cell cycle sensor histidine kinase/response regulator CckA
LPGRYACLSVSDTGTGIPPEILPRIFEPFFTTKDVGRGTGFGLASVFGIVKQHRGWIEVDNRPGEGVTFRVNFPILPTPVREAVPAARPASIRGGSETILLAEDESAVRNLICRVLERHGYTVLVAGNSQEAIQLWQQHREAVALLVTDIIMPEGLSGRELAARLQTEKAALKIVYISGYNAEFSKDELVDLGKGINFLQKPFGGRQLLETVRQSLDGE